MNTIWMAPLAASAGFALLCGVLLTATRSVLAHPAAKPIRRPMLGNFLSRVSLM